MPETTHSAVNANKRPHPPASTNSPQQLNKASQSPKVANSIARLRQSPRTATLSAIAMLPASSRGASSNSPSISSGLHASMSTRALSNTGSDASSSGTGIRRSPSWNANATGHRARGSLDRVANIPEPEDAAQQDGASDSEPDDVVILSVLKRTRDLSNAEDQSTPQQPQKPASGNGIEQSLAPTSGVSSGDIAQRKTSDALPSNMSNDDQIGSVTPHRTSLNDSVDPQRLPKLPGNDLSSLKSVDYERLVDGHAKVITAVSCLEISEKELEELIIELVESSGEPLVISDLHKTALWSSDLFSPQSQQEILTPEQNDRLHGEHLSQWSQWRDILNKVVHPRLAFHGAHDVSTSLQSQARPDTLRRYFGRERACIPLQRYMCSSLGQNLMVWSDPDASAVWMVTQSDDADALDRYIASKGGDPHSKRFVPHLTELADAGFPIFCWKQRVGDLVLIPPRASHLVVNIGGRTMQAAWSRMTVDTLTSALFNDLPLYQRICQVEGYHIKSIIEYTLSSVTKQVETHLANKRDTPLTQVRELRSLLLLYDAILSAEYVPEWRDIAVEGGEDSYVECDFCGADVLHGYFECPVGETLCALCYCQGRLCKCGNAVEALQPRQHWRRFGERLQIRNLAAKALLTVEPELALAIQDRSDAANDDAEQDSPLLPVEMLEEDEVGKRSWPLSFLAAMKLYKRRQTADWQTSREPCKICKASLDLSQRYHCKPCGHSYCFGCLLHELYIHPVHALAQNEAKQFHNYHKKASALDYKEWKQDPLEFLAEARAHFALIESARINMKSRPVTNGCRIGFLDVSDQYPQGLSGTLGVKQSIKAQVDQVKAVTDLSSRSATPVPRKRSNGSDEPTPNGSPKSPLRKKAKFILKRTGENGIPMMETPREQSILRDAVTSPVDTQLKPSVSSGFRKSDQVTQMTADQLVTPVPTVANGIRNFVLGLNSTGQSVPSLSAADQASTPVSSLDSSSVPSGSLDMALSKPTVFETSVSKRASTAAAKNVPNVMPVVPSSTSTATISSLAARAKLAAPSKFTPSANIQDGTGVSPFQRSSVPVPSPAPTVAPTATLSPSSPPNQSLTPALADETSDQGTLALATSAVAAGISSSPRESAAASPGSAAAGLGSLSNINLRVVTEILRIFSQSNQKSIEGQVAVILEAQMAQAEECKQAAAKEAEEQRQATAKVEATLLHRIGQLSQEVNNLAQQHKLEIRDLKSRHEAALKELRQKLHEVAGQQVDTVQRVKKFDEKLSGLLDDIERQAQAHLQAELSSQTLQPSDIGQPVPSTHFAPTSNVR